MNFNYKHHIENKRRERFQLLSFWNRIEELHSEVGLSEKTYKEIQAKISSKIAACDRSIQDHKKAETDLSDENEN